MSILGISACGPHLINEKKFLEENPLKEDDSEKYSIEIRVWQNCSLSTFLLLLFWNSCEENYTVYVKLETKDANDTGKSVSFESVKVEANGIEKELIPKDLPPSIMKFKKDYREGIEISEGFYVGKEFTFQDKNKIRVKSKFKLMEKNQFIEKDGLFVVKKERKIGFMYYRI